MNDKSDIIHLEIDGSCCTAKLGSTILQAAESIGIKIPTLCYAKDLEAFSSCMICVVENCRTGRLIPACSAPAEDGMIILSNSDPVRNARCRNLELLLSEHIGDCEAPCRMVCPSDLDIPAFLRNVKDGDFSAAEKILRQYGPICVTENRECPAPCEKACRRGRHDSALTIAQICRFVAAISKNKILRGQASEKIRQYRRGQFNSRLGKLIEGDIQAFLALTDNPTDSAKQEEHAELNTSRAQNEAARCLHCDCRKADNCKLRDLAQEYEANAGRWPTDKRPPVRFILDHPEIIYEPGKCIRCGICVRISQKYGEKLGMTFLGRGYGIQVAVPFDETLAKGLSSTAQACVEACPTAAIAWK